MGYNLRRKPRIQTQYGRTTCAGGCSEGRPRWHHSREESQYCNQLMMLLNAGEILSYRTQARYDIHDRLGKSCGYLLVDFEVRRPRRPSDSVQSKMDGEIVKQIIGKDPGQLEIHEYKGAGFMNSPEFRHKRALFTWCYPHIEYHTVGKKEIVF